MTESAVDAEAALRHRIEKVLAEVDAEAEKALSRRRTPDPADLPREAEYNALLETRKAVNRNIAHFEMRVDRLMRLMMNEPALRSNPYMQFVLEYNRWRLATQQLRLEDVRNKRFAIRQEKVLRGQYVAMWAAVVLPFATALAVAIVNVVSKR
jgi:hypothetical protein